MSDDAVTLNDGVEELDRALWTLKFLARGHEVRFKTDFPIHGPICARCGCDFDVMWMNYAWGEVPEAEKIPECKARRSNTDAE